MLDRRAHLLGPAYRLFYERPLHIVRGEGVWLYNDRGERFLDLYNNVPHVGHCHPAVVEALCSQSGTLNTHTRYLHDNVLNLAERLIEKLPDSLNTAMFSCTGSEANELAMRIARAVTGSEGFIVTDSAYHGNTRATFEISTEDIPEDDRPSHVVTIPNPDVFRGQYRGDDAGLQYAASVDAAVATLKQRGIKPAAMIVDTIVSSGGVVSPPPMYLAHCAERVRAAGALFIADEVQPGFGRTGQHFWGFERDGVVPDIVTMGKPMGNGHPLAATVVRREYAEAFSTRAHYFNTFGGNPVSAAAGLAVLDVIENDDLQQHALTAGDYLVKGLNALAERHETIGDVRGTGLFIAVELVVDREKQMPATTLAKRVVNNLRDRGVLCGSIGPDANVLKIRPPMVFTVEHADVFLTALDKVLQPQ